MVDEKPIDTTYDELEFSEKTNKESGMQKLFRAGALALGFSIVGKKMGLKSNDALKYTGVAAASMIMSRDDDRGGDLMAVGAVFGIASGTKMLKNMAFSDMKTYSKIYGKLETADKFVNSFNLSMMSLNDNFRKSFVKNLNEMSNENDSFITSAFNSIKAVGGTISDGVHYAYNNGMMKALEELSNSDLKQLYDNQYKNFDFKKFETDINDYLKSTKIDIKNTKVGLLENVASSIITAMPGFDGIDNMSVSSALKQFKKLKKIQLIENNTFFTDMIGMYSKLDKETGKVVARYGELFKDNANILKPMERLASNFERSLSKDESLKYLKSTSEDKEKMFLNYLKQEGFQELVDKFYKKDEHIKIGEINELFKNINVEEIQNKELSEFFNSSTRSQMGLFSTVKYKNDAGDIKQKIQGFKHADILSNFSFTNVLTKTEFGFQDSTALDGGTMLLKGLGALEDNVVSTFKTPFSKFNRLWNPLSMIDAKGRMKDHISNDILGFDYNEYGFILNGKRIKEETVEKIIDDKKKFIIKYSSDGTRDNKISYKRTSLESLNEGFSVAYNNIRNDSNIGDIIDTFKQKGIKNALSEFSYSVYNPFAFRYDSGKGFRGVLAKDGYFDDDINIWNLFSKKNPDNLYILNKTEDKKWLNKFLSTFIGDSSDINIDRMRAENQKYEEIMGTVNKKFMSMAMSNLLVKGGSDSAELANEVMNVMPSLYKTQQMLKYKDSEDIVTFLNDIAFETTDSRRLNSSFLALSNKLRQEGRSDLISSVAKTADEYIRINKNIENMKRNGFTINNIKEFVGSKVFQFYAEDNLRGNVNLAINKEAFKFIKKNQGKNTELEDVYNIVSDFKRANKAARKDMSETFKDSSNVFIQHLKQFNANNPVDSPTNPLNTIFELTRAKRYNDHYNSILKNNEELRKSVLDLADNRSKPLYSMTQLGRELEEDFNYITSDILGFGKKTNDFNINTYKYFDKIDKEITNAYDLVDKKVVSEVKEEFKNAKNFDLSFKQIIQLRDKLIYRDIGKSTSSIMVKDSLKKGETVREILRNVKNSILELINPKPFDENPIYYKNAKDKYKRFKSKNFDNLDSSFNIGAKRIINGMQNALEYIGVERLTNNDLGDYFSQQMWNFMSKRVVPIFAAASGAMAIDSASDAIIPDDVPIIGNGISGVAATGYATARIGAQYALKYTGGLSLMRMAENAMPGLISGAPFIGMLDPLMDPEEMKEVYFKGKAIRVNDNRWWFTAGRQSGQGEEFGQYRPHFLYQMQHKTSGVYDNKVEKFFRRDFLLTKYPWYIMDPYKEERDAYSKFGAVYPKTEQLFLDIPVIGHFLNATIGEMIKPTRYIGENEWRASDDMIVNPNYDPNNPTSPKYIKFTEPNKLISSVFEAIDDLETWSGLPGYLVKSATKGLFGSSNPYENEVTLKSIDKDTSYFKQFDNMQLGGLYGVTEPIRRLLDDGNGLGTIDINPLKQRIPDWMPEFYQKGNNPYLSMSGGEYLMPGEDFDKINKGIKNEDLLKLRTLSMLAPYSKEFDETKSRLMNSNLSGTEEKHFFESLGYANEYGKTNHVKERGFKARNLDNIELKIDKKIAPNEFISNGIRYKFDTVTDDFNKLVARYGTSEASGMLSRLNSQFQEGETYSFQISKDATVSGGIDMDGDYFKITSNEIDKRLDLDRSAYNSMTFSEMIGKFNFLHKLKSNNAMPINFEKRYGTKTATAEWATEHVQAPSFRDWDNPMSSFIMPFYTFSANSKLSAFNFGTQTDEMYYRSNATTDVLGGMVKLGALRNIAKNLTFGDAITSSEYDNETVVHDELEKIKFLAGDKSYFNMTGEENLKQFEHMVNEEDAKYLEELANTQRSSERRRILSHANDRLSNVLKTIWNRQQEQLTGSKKYQVQKPIFDQAPDIGYYDGNEDRAKLLLKKSLGITRSKLDDKRHGIISSYRGSVSYKEAKYIQDKMYQRYNARAGIDSTIFPDGIININRRREE